MIKIIIRIIINRWIEIILNFIWWFNKKSGIEKLTIKQIRKVK